MLTFYNMFYYKLNSYFQYIISTTKFLLKKKKQHFKTKYQVHLIRIKLFH